LNLIGKNVSFSFPLGFGLDLNLSSSQRVIFLI